MFDEFDNIYPQKPEIRVMPLKIKLQKSLFFMVIIFGLLFYSLQDGVVLLASLFGVVMFHELGHFLGMKLFKFKENKVFYFPLFSAMLKQKTDYISQRHYLITLLLGPLPGIIVGTVFLYLFFQNPTNNDIMLEIASMFLVVNIFTLIPLDPLDGGRIVEYSFFPTNQKIKMYFVLASSIAIIFIGFFSQFYVLMAIGFLMGFKVKSIQKNDSIYEELEEQDVNYKKTYASLSNKEYWKIRTVFLENNPKIRNLIPTGDMLWENEKLLTDQISMILKNEVKQDASPFFIFGVFAVIGLALYFPLTIISQNTEFFLNILADAGY